MSYKIVIKYIPQMTIGLSEEVHTAEFPFREKEKCQDALDFLENLIAEGLACGLVNYDLVYEEGQIMNEPDPYIAEMANNLGTSCKQEASLFERFPDLTNQEDAPAMPRIWKP